MNTSNAFQPTQEQYKNTTEINWKAVYLVLKPLAKRIVYAYRVPAWHGQENDVVDDIIQEATRKLFEYEHKMEKGDVSKINSLLPMARAIAYNYVKDMRRRDMRITHIEEQDDDAEQQGVPDDVVDAEALATENAYCETLFADMAQEIVQFPYKQRQALLVDLANHMSFEQYPTPLQKAFLNVGIQLQDYQQQLPETPQERNRYTALLAHAYRRVSALSCAQAYIESDDLCS